MTPAGKGELDAVAWSMGKAKKLGDCVLELVRFYAANQGKADIRLEARQQHRMMQEIEENLIKRLVAHGQLAPPALSAPAVVPPPIQEPPADGMLRCHKEKGHPDYPAFSKSGKPQKKCPKCDAEQHQERRAKEKAQQGGG
jgi:hypothetical protein